MMGDQMPIRQSHSVLLRIDLLLFNG